MKWAGHMVRVKDERLPKRFETKKEEGCRKRGLCEERSKKGEGGRKVERATGSNGKKFITKVAVQWTDN